jgi:hypothetical protein
MKNWLRSEEWLQFFVCFGYFIFADIAWWWFWAFLLLPDISMLGYLINTKAGAYFYNLGHHKGIALLVFALGLLFSLPFLSYAGCILYGHSSLDRALGFGLKYPDNFKNTHLKHY